MTKYEVNIKDLLTLRLGFEEHFILYCLYKKDKKLITSYTNECKKINTEIFKKLATEGYLLINNQKDSNIHFEYLSLEEKGRLLFDNSDIGGCSSTHFEEFRNNYPSSTKGGRRLHSDLSRCRKLYKEITKEISHEVLCKCARLYVQEKKKTNSEDFIQSLPTWLHQHNYEQYIDDVETDIQQDNYNFDII